MPSNECFPGLTATELPRCVQALIAPEAERSDSRVTAELTWPGRDIDDETLWSAQALLALEAELPDSRVALGQPLSKSRSSRLVGLASLESVHAHRAIL